ncbi:fasciclin domain-containing protein [Flavimaricola marinus]|uniref:Cell surface lipoprotein MPB83 n=1 Tax=Flavimaricola marinus TaxID=1819565 RepID=A0A238LHZ9_9RHOB|nr:fasciclin domain-containing protein [Flavimaricola marinus]SMY09034.1 Cell surface lipoprotein MPB83 precursor [Flavimaricola marinus]
MNRRSALKLTGAAGLAALVSACAPAGTSYTDVVGTLAGNSQFSTLVAAVGAAGLVETLQGPGPFTVFAPTDAAFAALPPGTVDALLADPEALAAILTYHVVPGKVTSDQLAGQMLSVATVNGAEVQVNGTNGVTVNNATVTQADIMASNGVIHRIDTVLLP